MRHLAPETPLFEVIGARLPALKRLEKMGIRTVDDLLRHFPARYEDFSKTYAIADLEPGQQATIHGVVEDIRARHSWRRNMSIVEATIADESGSIRAVWFNQPYVATALKTGREANFAGKASVSEEGEIYLSSPTYEVIRTRSGEGEDGAQEMNHTARLVPVYPETHGITSRGIRFVVQQLFRRKPEFKEWIPAGILQAFRLPEVNAALRAIHFPKRMADATRARERFSFEDLFLLQVANLKQKMAVAAERAQPMAVDIERIKRLLGELPFALTPSQKKALWEIIQDIEKPHPMNRLLQGDVGSGKTVVAAIAAIIAAENGYQSAFMAPTEILARQHFETMKKLLARISTDSGTAPAIGLLTSGSAVAHYGADMEARSTKAEFGRRVAAGEIAIIFGTHALIQKSVKFARLGLVIIDEQHRFGVRQRAELTARRKESSPASAGAGAGGGAPLVPHFLSMSATPIPRTLMLSIFGDLDLSLITELPAGRKAITTSIVPPQDREKAYGFIRAQVQEGRQVFVICPRIDVPDEEDKEKARASADPRQMKTLELKSVKEEFEKLSKTIFPDLRVAMLHGQMKAREKEEIMKQFKAREYDILVSTSVVEVGVDVPNATLMMIEGAERFGLAQLYQFRGRVGRGEHQSYCFLMTDTAGGAANARLKAILEAKNGFELAEKDLALRGPGQFFGQVQTGLPDIAMEALRDPELVKEAREAAANLLGADPQLKSAAPLRRRLMKFLEDLHEE